MKTLKSSKSQSVFRPAQKAAEDAPVTDKRSKETIEIEQRKIIKEAKKMEKERLKTLGIMAREKPSWINYIRLPDKRHAMGTNELMTSLEIEPFNEELRYNPEYHDESMFFSKPYFRLCFGQLKAIDKKKFLGYSYNLEEQNNPKVYFQKFAGFN